MVAQVGGRKAHFASQQIHYRKQSGKLHVELGSGIELSTLEICRLATSAHTHARSKLALHEHTGLATHVHASRGENTCSAYVSSPIPGHGTDPHSAHFMWHMAN